MLSDVEGLHQRKLKSTDVISGVMVLVVLTLVLVIQIQQGILNKLKQSGF